MKPTGSKFRQWSIKSSMRSVKPGAKNEGSMATKQWPRFASFSHVIQVLMFGLNVAPEIKNQLDFL